MGKYRFSLKVKCDLYDGERSQELYCKGLVEGNRIHMGFSHPGMMDQWKAGYCESRCLSCPIARMIRAYKKDE